MPDPALEARPYRKFDCQICGHVYDEAEGDPDSGLPPGTRWEDVPEDWECPVCRVRKSDYVELVGRAG